MRIDALTTLLADFELFLKKQDLTPPNTRPHPAPQFCNAFVACGDGYS
jgi:hypothetical protein